MKQLRALLMLGPFLILGLVAIALIAASVASVFLVNAYFGDVYDLVERRNQYQRVESSLLQLQVISRQAIMIGLYGETDDVGGSPEFDALQAPKQASLATIASALEELDFLAYEDIHYERIEALQAARDQYEANFDEMLSIANDENAVYALLDEQRDGELTINENMRTLISDTNIELNQATQDMEYMSALVIWIVLGVLMLFPLLAVIGFLLASRFTQPLLQIDNSVMAVGGSHYRPALMEDTLRRRDSLGRLAKSVDSMANALKARDAALESEVADLRHRLNDMRRRKLSTTVDIPVSDLLGGQHVQ